MKIFKDKAIPNTGSSRRVTDAIARESEAGRANQAANPVTANAARKAAADKK